MGFVEEIRQQARNLMGGFYSACDEASDVLGWMRNNEAPVDLSEDDRKQYDVAKEELGSTLDSIDQAPCVATMRRVVDGDLSGVTLALEDMCYICELVRKPMLRLLSVDSATIDADVVAAARECDASLAELQAGFDALHG